jgi:hypothetical protein
MSESRPETSAGASDLGGFMEAPLTVPANSPAAAVNPPTASAELWPTFLAPSAVPRITLTRVLVSTSSISNDCQTVARGPGRVAPRCPTSPNIASKEQAGEDCAGELSQQVVRHPSPREVALDRKRERDDRVEVRAGNRAEHVNQRCHREARSDREREAFDMAVAGRGDRRPPGGDQHSSRVPPSSAAVARHGAAASTGPDVSAFTARRRPRLAGRP